MEHVDGLEICFAHLLIRFRKNGGEISWDFLDLEKDKDVRVEGKIRILFVITFCTDELFIFMKTMSLRKQPASFYNTIYKWHK